jgi:hypothetical protein
MGPAKMWQLVRRSCEAWCRPQQWNVTETPRYSRTAAAATFCSGCIASAGSADSDAAACAIGEHSTSLEGGVELLLAGLIEVADVVNGDGLALGGVVFAVPGLD